MAFMVQNKLAPFYGLRCNTFYQVALEYR